MREKKCERDGPMQTEPVNPPAWDAPCDAVRSDGDTWTQACAVFWLAAGGLLRERREARGWSQPGLARRAAVAHGTVAQFELGEHRAPALEEWRRVVLALELDPVQCIDATEHRAMRLLHADLAPPAAPSVRQPVVGSARPLAPRTRRVRHALHALADDLRVWARTGDRLAAVRRSPPPASEIAGADSWESFGP
jgi:transcriptional regulator with XRE-family HTH domain